MESQRVFEVAARVGGHLMEQAADELIRSLREARYQAEALREYGDESSNEADARRYDIVASKLLRALGEIIGIDDALAENADACMKAATRVSGN